MTESKTCIDMEKTGMRLKLYAEERGYSVKQTQRYLDLQSVLLVIVLTLQHDYYYLKIK